MSIFSEKERFMNMIREAVSRTLSRSLSRKMKGRYYITFYLVLVVMWSAVYPEKICIVIF